MEPTKAELEFVQKTLGYARQGGASLTDLAQAHDIAQKYKMVATTAELRKYLISHVPGATTPPISYVKMMGLGMLTGIFTHFFLKTVGQR